MLQMTQTKQFPQSRLHYLSPAVWCIAWSAIHYYALLYSVSKTRHIFYRNFGKCTAILKILSSSDSQVNFARTCYKELVTT